MPPRTGPTTSRATRAATVAPDAVFSSTTSPTSARDGSPNSPGGPPPRHPHPRVRRRVHDTARAGRTSGAAQPRGSARPRQCTHPCPDAGLDGQVDADSTTSGPRRQCARLAMRLRRRRSGSRSSGRSVSMIRMGASLPARIRARVRWGTRRPASGKKASTGSTGTRPATRPPALHEFACKATDPRVELVRADGRRARRRRARAIPVQSSRRAAAAGPASGRWSSWVAEGETARAAVTSLTSRHAPPGSASGPALWSPAWEIRRVQPAAVIDNV